MHSTATPWHSLERDARLCMQGAPTPVQLSSPEDRCCKCADEQQAAPLGSRLIVGSVAGQGFAFCVAVNPTEGAAQATSRTQSQALRWSQPLESPTSLRHRAGCWVCGAVCRGEGRGCPRASLGKLHRWHQALVLPLASHVCKHELHDVAEKYILRGPCSLSVLVDSRLFFLGSQLPCQSPPAQNAPNPSACLHSLYV